VGFILSPFAAVAIVILGWNGIVAKRFVIMGWILFGIGLIMFIIGSGVLIKLYRMRKSSGQTEGPSNALSSSDTRQRIHERINDPRRTLTLAILGAIVLMGGVIYLVI
jgi:hypothetical protein